MQQNLLAHLTELIDPESLIPIRAAKGIREQFKRDVVDKYMSNPERALARLVGHLNQIAIKSQWGLYGSKNGTPNLHLRGYGWVLQRTQFAAKDKIYQWLATVLELDELSNLGRCRTCLNFFVRN